MADWCTQAGPDVLLRVKVVPGASRDAIAGLLGDRLKIRVAAPPEDGKANAAACRLIAKAIGVPPKSITVEVGQTNPEKTLRVQGAIAAAVRPRLVAEE